MNETPNYKFPQLEEKDYYDIENFNKVWREEDKILKDFKDKLDKVHSLTTESGLKFEEIDNEIDKITTTQSEYSITQDGIKASLSEITEDINQANNNITTLKQKTNDFEISIDGVSNTITETQKSLNDSIEKINKLETTVDSFKSEISVTENIVNSLKNNIDSVGNVVNQKSKTFITTPYTPYKVGDLWTDGTGSDLKMCIISRDSGDFLETDWALATKYTDDTKANAVDAKVNIIDRAVTENTEQLSSINQQIDNINISVRNAEELIEETIVSINDKVSKDEIYLKSEVYTKEETNSAINIVEDSINLKVSSLENTTATINGEVTNLTNRMSSAENKITDSAIISTVSNAISTAKSEAINSANSSTDTKLQNYATTSSLTQTADSITAKFQSSGGFNLLKNSKGKNGISFWLNNGNEIGTGSDSTFGTCFKLKAPSGMKYFEAIKLKNNTEYVYEGYVYSREVITGNSTAPLHFWCNTSPNTAGQPQLSILDYRQDVLSKDSWTKCYVHFRTASSGEVYFTPFIYIGSGNFDLWATELSLAESSVESKWTPHPSEVYEGSTIIDSNGVTVNNGALTVKDGSGNIMLRGDSAGNLSVHKQLVIGGNTSGIIEVKNSSNQNIAKMDKDGIAVKDGVMKITSGDVTTMGTGYPEGNPRDMSIHSYGTSIRETDYTGSQITKRHSDYQGGHSLLMVDNTSNGLQASYRNYQTANYIALQKAQDNLNFYDTLKLNGDNGQISVNSLALNTGSGVNLSNSFLQSGNCLNINTGQGTLDIGPQNTSHCHYTTDRSNHWFNKPISVNGAIYCGTNHSQQVAYGWASNSYDNGTGQPCEGRVHLGSNVYILYGWCSISCSTGVTAERTYKVPNLKKIYGIQISCWTNDGTGNFGEVALKTTYSDGFTFRLYNSSSGGTHYITYMIVGLC